jgi:hypothetical protein
MEQDDQIFLLVKKGQFEALKDGLAKLQEPHLRRIAAYWLGSQDAMLQAPDDLSSLLKEAMGSAVNLFNVLDRLPKKSYDLLYYILSEGGSVSLEELKTGFSSKDKKGLREALQPLTVRGLVWELRTAAADESGARLHVLSTCAAHLQMPSFLEGKLGTLLPHRSKEQLHNLVESLEGDAKQLSRNREIIPWLKSQLRNPVRLRRYIETFDLNDRKLFKILALHPMGLTASTLQHEYSLFCQKDPEEELQDMLDNLTNRLGLLHVDYASPEAGEKRVKEPVYRLPREIAHIIRFNFKEKYSDDFRPISIFLPPDEDFALSSRSKERSSLWIDFQQLLNHLVRCEVGVIRKGGMHKKNLKRILDRLEGHPVDAYHYLDFLFLYAYEREILYPEGERWKINVKNLLPVQHEAAFCWDFWTFYRNNASWNDRDSSPLQGVLQKGDSNYIFSLRRAILRLLWDCPVNQWIEMKMFFDSLMDREESFRNGEIPLAGMDPLREKYRFVKSTMERSLTWLGVVDTTTITSRRVDLFRLNDIGSWLLAGKPNQAPFAPREEAESVTVQNNLEITVPAGFPLEKQLYLARFTDDHKGRIVVTRASIRRGLEYTLSAREMREFLADHAQNTLPGNLDHIIQEVVEKSGNIFVGGEPTRLEVSDQMLMDELLEQKRFMPFIQERADAKKAYLRRGADLEKLLEELRSAGYSPRVL